MFPTAELEGSLGLPQPCVFYSQPVLSPGLRLLQGGCGAGDAEQSHGWRTFCLITGK